MNCDQARTYIEIYADNQLDDVSVSLLKTHLEVCEACRLECNQATELTARCKALRVEVPGSLRSVIADRAHLAESKARRFWGLPRIISLLAGASATAVLISFLFLATTNPAEAAFRGMQRAIARVTNVEVTQTGLSYGRAQFRIKYLLEQGGSRFAFGNFYYVVRDGLATAFDQDGHPVRPASGNIPSAASYDLRKLQADLSKSGVLGPVLDLGEDRIEGKQTRKITFKVTGVRIQAKKDPRFPGPPLNIMPQYQSELREVFWIDEQSDLPARREKQYFENGSWTPYEIETYRFNIPNTDGIFRGIK